MTADNATTGDAGVGLLRYVVGHQLKWAFRDLPTLDFGVDAEMERLDQGNASGHLIGLQIKSGRTYFDEPTTDGWVYRPKQRHVDYWTNHVLPIFVVLVDLDASTCYWQAVNADTLKRSRKSGWKLEVPRANTLETAAVAWTEAAENRDREAERYLYTNCRFLPPSVATVISRATTEAPLFAARMAERLSRGVPDEILRDLLDRPPSWFDHDTALSWRIAAAFASEHELQVLAAECLAKGVEGGASDPARDLATAALYLHPTDPDRARELLEAGRLLDQHHPLIEISGNLITHPADELPPLTPQTANTTIERSRPAVTAYQREAALRRDELTLAIRYGHEAMLQAPENTQYQLAIAQLYLRRSAGSQSGPDDLGAALENAIAVIGAREPWNGPLLEPILTVIQGHMLRRDTSAVRHQATPRPIGQLPPALENEPAILLALFKAHLIDGNLGTAQAIAERVPTASWRVRMNADLATLKKDRPEQRLAWASIAEDARILGDYRSLAAATFHLATLGVSSDDDWSTLLARGNLSVKQVDVLRSIAATHAGVSGSERTLRSLADSDVTAAEAYIEYLASNDRLTDAIGAAERAAQRLRNPYLLLHALDLLEQVGDQPAVEALAQRVLTDGRVTGSGRSQALRILALGSSRVGDWPTAELHCAAALKAEAPSVNPAWVWRLIVCQINQRADQRALDTWLKYRPLVRDEQEVRLWLHVNQYIDWADADVETALELESRFADVPDVSAAILTKALLTDATAPGRADGTDETDETAAPFAHRLQAQLELHIAQHGQAGGITQIQGSPETLVDQISGMAQVRAGRVADFQRRVSRGDLPYGLLAGATGRSYCLMLAMNAAPLAAGTLDEATFDEEVATCNDTVNHPVVVGLDALHIACCLEETADLLSRFSDPILTLASRDDLLRGVREARDQMAEESFVWSEAHGGLVLVEAAPDQAQLARLHLSKMDDHASRMTLAGSVDLSLFPELDSKGAGSWLSPLQVAFETGRALWTDDRVLRQLASGLNIKAFGTMALMQHLEELGEPTDSFAVVKALTRRSVVDLPMTVPLWREIAEEDNWAPTVATLVASRPPFWTWIPGIVDDFRDVVRLAEATYPGSRRLWRRAAMTAIARLGNHPDSSRQLVDFCLLGAGEFTNDELADRISEGLRDARQVADELGLSDPIRHLSEYISSTFTKLIGPNGLAELERLVRLQHGTGDRGPDKTCRLATRCRRGFRIPGSL